MLRFVVLVCVACIIYAQPSIGPYSTSSTTLTCNALDKSNHGVVFYYPSNETKGTKFPLIAYAHGMAGGGVDMLGYTALFSQMASYGFVIAAPKSCSNGCTCGASHWTKCNGLPGTSPSRGWPEYYGETLKTIDFCKNSTGNIFDLIDWSKGVGIAGHSMGGQSTASAATKACTQAYDIRAAVLHHAASGDTKYGNTGSNVSVPTASFTSTGDSIWKETRDIYEAIPKGIKTVYRNQIGFSHLEPVLWPPVENPFLATFTAAWFQIYLNGDTGEYYDLIYGNASSSLCHYAEMKECHVDK